MNGPDGTTASDAMSNAAAEDMNGAFGGIAPFDPSQTPFNGGAPAGYWPPPASSSAPQNGGAAGILPAEHPSTSSAPPSQMCGAPINSAFPPIFSETDSMFSQQQQAQQQQQNFDSHQQQMMRQQNIMRLQQQQQFMAANSGADGSDAQAFQQLQQQQNLMYMQQQQQQQQQQLQQLQQQQQVNMHSPMFSPQPTQQPQQNGLNGPNINNNINPSSAGGGMSAEFTSPTNGGVTPNFASPGGTPMNGANATRMNASPQKNGWPNGMTPQQFQMQQQQHMLIEQQRRMINGSAPQMMIGAAAAPMMMMNGAVRPRPPVSNALLFTSDMANVAVRDVKENKKFDNLAAWHFANCPPSTSAAAMMGSMPPNGMMPPSAIPSFPPMTGGGMYPGMMPGTGVARSPMNGPPADFSAFNPSNNLPNGSASPATAGAATPGQSTRGTKRKASVQANSTPSPSLAHPMSGSTDGGAYGDAASRATPADGRNSLSSAGAVATAGGFLSPKSEISSDMGPSDPLKRIEMMTKQHIEEPSVKMARSDNSASGASAGGNKSSTTPTASGGSMPNASREQKLAQLTEIRQKLKLDDNSEGGFAMPGAMAAGHMGMMPNFKPGQLTAEQQQQMLTMQMRQQQAFMAAQQQQMPGSMPAMPHGGGMMPPTFVGGPGGMPPTMMPGGAGMDGMPPPNPQMMMMMNSNNGDPTGGMNNGQIATQQQRMLMQQRQYQMQQHEQQQRLMVQAMSSAPPGAATNTPTNATSMNGDAFGGAGIMDPMQANGLLGMWGPPGQHSMPQSLTNLDARVPVQKMQYYAQATGGDAQAAPTQ